MEIKIQVPGSKSIANRAMILNALSGNKTILKNIPECEDTKYMEDGLKELKGNNPKLFTGNAGTATRFLTAYSTLLNKEIVIDGNKRMRERPIEALCKALNDLGAEVNTTNQCPPVKISSQKITGGEISLPGNISSQYISALLMIGPFTKKGITINIEQELCSQPYVDITIKLMQSYGLKIVNNNYAQFKVEPKSPSPPQTYTVESDCSSASYIGAYAALNPEKTVILKNIKKKSIQGDIKFIDYLKKMGCKIKESKENTTIKGPKTLKSLGKVDMNNTPDLVMTFAVLAAFTPGKTTISNISNLKIKETDRIDALKKQLKKLQVKVKTGYDFIEIEGKNKNKLIESLEKSKISIETYNDHRIAMAFGILTSIIPQLTVKNPNCVSKSYTTYWKDLKKLMK
ncbi:MAG: 3-phosphoshikimate 1-carboxyvinyltransferase [bacterium]|nr:3-phosphoshikimate 1-carboxyvinyltransferase [bacterium]